MGRTVKAEGKTTTEAIEKGLKELNPIKGKESKIFIKDSTYNDTNYK
jgi:predicted RNA-binding protein Jag